MTDFRNMAQTLLASDPMSTFTVSSLYQWPRHCTPKARETVLNIINSSKTPLATKDIYKLAVKPTRVSTPAPHAGEEIRSMRFLKTVVLRDLAAQNRVEKVRTQGAFTAWLWRPKQAPLTSTTKSTAATPTATELTPAAVGVGEDWSHLNKRRQRTRKMKVERDLRRMLEVQKMQRKAA
ncbi:hypothetical protein OG21DRAFT_1499127 [Imleria badia]|nr:hypothetical protein OG21DRAFT_1499127 [Imleria badia]